MTDDELNEIERRANAAGDEQTWHVVTVNGAMRPVVVCRDLGGWFTNATGCHGCATPHDAVMEHAREERWSVAEVLMPGQKPRAEIERENAVLRERIDAAVAAEREARTILDVARETPPSREEFDALIAEGGHWRTATDDSTVFLWANDRPQMLLGGHDGRPVRWLWIPLDRDRRPCAWPVAP